MKISFCTTCHDRTFQLRQTIHENLLAIRSDGNCEMVLVNYNSPDNLDWYIRRHFKAEIEAGYLKYVGEKKVTSYHAARAHNISHFVSTGDYVINLDGDNFIDGNIESARKLWSDNPNLVIQWYNGHGTDGTFGRIGMSRAIFNKLGGYDEGLPPLSGQDKDIIERARVAGYEVARVSGVSCAIKNPRDLTRVGPDWKDKDYHDMMAISNHIIQSRRPLGVSVVNQDRKKVRVQINWGEEIEV